MVSAEGPAAGTGESPPDTASAPESTAELQARVARLADEHRADGHYPEGIEEQLDRHWRRITATAPNGPRQAMRSALGRYRAEVSFRVPAAEARSRMPGGRFVHRIIQASVRRNFEDLTLQLDEFARRLQDVLVAIVEVTDDVPGHEHPGLVSQLEVIDGQLDELRRDLNRQRRHD
jgi:hypothetical protein